MGHRVDVLLLSIGEDGSSWGFQSTRETIIIFYLNKVLPSSCGGVRQIVHRQVETVRHFINLKKKSLIEGFSCEARSRMTCTCFPKNAAVVHRLPKMPEALVSATVFLGPEEKSHLYDYSLGDDGIVLVPSLGIDLLSLLSTRDARSCR